MEPVLPVHDVEFDLSVEETGDISNMTAEQYLAWVHYQAQQLPLVSRAEIDPAKLEAHHQSRTMPTIPAIEACPPGFEPNESWERNILEQFQLLRSIMTQQQIHGGSMWQTIKRITSQPHGGWGLTRGLLPFMIRDASYLTGFIAATSIISNYLTYDRSWNPEAAVVSGSIIGSASVCAITQPFDVIKTYMQADSYGVKYTGFIDAYWKLYAEGGIPIFYRGTGWRCTNMIAALFVNMQLQRLFHDIYDNQ